MALVPALRRRRVMPLPVPACRPRHVGVVMDGNRRWARAAGYASASVGHKAGAKHVEQLLDWCTSWGIDHVTAYVLSAGNIRKRDPGEVGYLFELLADTVPELIGRTERWQLHVSGDLAMLPAGSRDALVGAMARTAERPAHLTLAIGYDGRADIVEGIRGALRDSVADVDVDAISAHLPGGPVKDIDLVIRTSGEKRLSGFFPWQTAGAEIFFSPKMWPAFGPEDFAEALRYYAAKRPSA